jgi:hypothetical protein
MTDQTELERLHAALAAATTAAWAASEAALAEGASAWEVERAAEVAWAEAKKEESK